MRRLFKIVFIMLVLAWGAASLRHAQGHHVADSNAALEIYETGDKSASTPSRIQWVTRQAVTWAKDYEIDE